MAGFDGGLADLAQLPLTEKDELRATRTGENPFGAHLCVEPAEIVRIYSTSGTTGTPSYIPLTAGDLENWVTGSARSYAASGVRPGQRIVSTYNAGPFAAGAALAAFDRIGLTHIPVGTGNTERLLRTIEQLRPEAAVLTPSYAAYLAENHDLRDSSVERVLVAGEPGGGEPGFRAQLEQGWGARVTEAMGIGDIGVSLWGECERAGRHAPGRARLRPRRARRPGRAASAIELDDGAAGELVLTHLRHRAAPLLRFRTRDHVVVRTSACPCGRTGPRIRCVGRTDDMLIVRGVNVFPSAIREVVSAFAPAVSGNILVRPQARGVKQEPPLPVSVELGRDGGGRRGGDPRPAARGARRADARGARAVGEPAAKRVQVEAGGTAAGGRLMDESGDSEARPSWVASARGRGEALLAQLEGSREEHASIEVGFRWLLRDKEIAGGVLGGGLAYRFFFWVLALSLLTSAGLGFAASAEADVDDASAEAGLSDSVQSTIATAAAQSENGRWWLLVLGVVFTLWFSLGLVRALRLVHSAAWRIAPQPLSHAPQSIALIVAAPFAFALTSAVAGWVRADIGFLPGLAATLATCVIYGLFWLWASAHLPAPDVPWPAFVPGAVLFAVGLEALHVLTVYYLADRLADQSALYGALGLAASLLFFLFLIGRGVVWSAELNAVDLGAAHRTRSGPLLAEAAASTAATAAAAAREAASAAARPRRGRRQRGAEARGQVADRHRGRAGAEVAAGRDPVDRAGLRELLGHVQVRGLQHSLGDAEGDPVHEVALPQRERRGRRLAEPREVGQIAAERLPALGLGLRLARAAAPELPLGQRPDQHGRVEERADGQGEQDGVAPARVDRAPAVDREVGQHHADSREDEHADAERERAHGREPAPLAHLRAHARLERREALRHRLTFLLDLLAEAREPLGAAVQHSVDDVGDVALPRRQRQRSRRPC